MESPIAWSLERSKTRGQAAAGLRYQAQAEAEQAARDAAALTPPPALPSRAAMTWGATPAPGLPAVPPAYPAGPTYQTPSAPLVAPPVSLPANAPYWEAALAGRGIVPEPRPITKRLANALARTSKALPASVVYGPIVGGYQGIQAGRGEEIVPQEAGPERTAYLATQAVLSGGTLRLLPITEQARNLEEQVAQVGGEFAGAAVPWEAAFRLVGAPAAVAAGPLADVVGSAASRLAARFGRTPATQEGARALGRFLTREAVRGGAAGGAIETARLATEPPKTAGEGAARVAGGALGTAAFAAGAPLVGEALGRFVARPIARMIGDRMRRFVPVGEAQAGVPFNPEAYGYRFTPGKGNEPGLWVRQDPATGLHTGIQVERRIGENGQVETWFQAYQEAPRGAKAGPKPAEAGPVIDVTAKPAGEPAAPQAAESRPTPAPPTETPAETPSPSPAVPVTTKPGGKPDVAWTRDLKAGDSVRVKGRAENFTVVDATKDPSLVSLKSTSGAELKVGRAALEPVEAGPVVTQTPVTIPTAGLPDHAERVKIIRELAPDIPDQAIDGIIAMTADMDLDTLRANMKNSLKAPMPGEDNQGRPLWTLTPDQFRSAQKDAKADWEDETEPQRLEIAKAHPDWSQKTLDAVYGQKGLLNPPKWTTSKQSDVILRALLAGKRVNKEALAKLVAESERFQRRNAGQQTPEERALDAVHNREQAAAIFTNKAVLPDSLPRGYTAIDFAYRTKQGPAKYTLYFNDKMAEDTFQAHRAELTALPGLEDVNNAQAYFDRWIHASGSLHDEVSTLDPVKNAERKAIEDSIGIFLGGSASVLPPSAEQPTTTQQPPEAAPAAGAEPQQAGKIVPSKGPTPDRVRNIGRGKHGSVRVIFPDALHAAIFAMPEHMRQGKNVQVTDTWIRKKLGNQELAFQPAYYADIYRRAVQEAIQDLPAGATYEAPDFNETLSRYDQARRREVAPQPTESAQPAPAETSASAAEKPSFKEGDRVTYTGRKGEKLTGTVRSVDSDGEASVDVDQVRTAGGVPIGRVEYVPVSRLSPADQPQQESAAFPVETKNIPLIRYQKEEGPATFSDVRGGIWFARINNIHGEKTGYEKTFGPTGGQHAVKETYTPKNPLLIVDTESAGAGDAAIRRLKSEAYLDRILDMWASDKLGAFLKAEFGVPDEQVQALLSHPDRIQAILDRVGTELARRAGYDSIIHTTPNGVYTEVVKLEKPSTGATTTAVTAAVPVQPEPKPETPAATGIQVRENEAKDGVEIKFPGRPSDATILKLREQGFRWHKVQKLWYAQRTPERLAFARSLAGGEAQSATPAGEKKEPQPPATNTQPEKRIMETGGSQDGGATGPVRPDGRGALEEAPAQDVSRPEAGGQAAAGPVRRAGEDQGGNRRPAGEGPGLSPGVGNGPGGLDTAAGRGEQAEPRGEPRNLDTARTVAGNYIITEADHLGEGGPKTKVRQNLDAIRLVKKLEQEGRLATPEEQAVLVKYVGWGAFPQLFAYYGPGYNEWAAERKELQALLTEKELEAARASTTNAHYTSRQVIDAIYQGIRHLGFDGGRVLEPSMGSGNFFGLMPTDMAAHSKLTGVELDNITGAIAKQLYPKADIRVMGFEETTLPDNFYDLAVSNVPFGNYKLHDPKYTKYNLWIHDYFFAKAMDKVRPGGIVAFITSTGTMNTPHSKTIRKMMAEQADLLLAVRLPGEAFKENAGTEVTTDILFLQKREPGAAPKGEAWLETAATGMTSPYNGQPLMVNEYFARHPDRMLGKLVDDKLHPGRAALAADGRDMQKALAEAMAKLPEGVYSRRAIHKATEEPEAKVMVPAPDHVKQGAYAVKDGKILRRVGDMMESVEMEAATADRIKGMIQVRDAVRDLFRAQYGEADQAAVGAAQKHLNKTYDTFVKKNGALHSKANRKAYESDPDLPLLLALENWDPKTKTATKTDIFTKRTLQHQKQITAVETAKEALVVSLNERGRIDWARMTSLTGKPAETLQDNLKGLVFKNPEGDWEPADQYLSGNVRQKLAVARAAAANDPAFLDNISALEAVQPQDLTEDQIDVKLGAAWLPPEYIQEFLASLLNVNSGVVSVQHNTGAAVWTVEATAYARNQVAAQQKWGTSDLDAIDLVEMALNNRIPTVRRTDPATKTSWVDQEATLAARAKLDEIKTEFKTWLWKDANRKAFAVRKYNDEFNSIRPRTFDGSHLTLPGMAAHITLRPHQKDAIWRVIQTGNTLLGHEVGAGKTWEMAGAAMELRRLGLAKKPMFVVPNHLIEQWPKEFLELYPGANILAAGKDDFKPEKRQELMSRIATGDWDAVIVPHSSFEKIPMSEQVIEDFFQEQIAELEVAILQARSEQQPQYGRGRKKDSRLVKELEKSKKRLETKMKDRLDKRRKDKTVDFEELGVDALFVDEAHEFKNLWYVTRMTRVAGLPNSEANKTFDLYMKTSYLNKLTGGRGVVFATGTPISNTMAEMFHMMRYLMPDAIKAYGIHNFDAWANLFGEIVPILELSPEGKGLRVNNRFARFVNLPELLRLFFETADIKTFEMLAETDPELAASRPEAETITIASPASAPLQQFIETLVARAELIRRGGIGGKQDNMLLVTTDGRKVALDLRMIDPDAPDLPDSKINQVVNGVFKEWQDGKKDRLTQLVFLDLAKPKSAKGKKKEAKTEEAQEELDIADLLEDQDYNPDFNPYDEMKAKLIAKGIPEKEIAFIHDATTDAKKLALFDAVNSGEVRVLMGSTKKMGAGMNVQQRLVAIHHVDAPWRPGDVEQRNGRGLRQGNTNKKIRIYHYVTKGSFDTYMWQTIETKAKFIIAIMRGDLTVREMEDISGTALTAAEVKAAASGNPLLQEKVLVDSQVVKYQSLYRSHVQGQRTLQGELAVIPSVVAYREKERVALRTDLETAKAHDVSGDKFEIEIDGTKHADREAAGEAIQTLFADFYNKHKNGETQLIGHYAGFELYLAKGVERYASDTLLLKGAGTYGAKVSMSSQGTITSIRRAVGPDDLEAQAKVTEQQIAALRKKAADIQEELTQPFKYEQELKDMLVRQEQINRELGIGQQTEQIVDTEGADEGADSDSQTAGMAGVAPSPRPTRQGPQRVTNVVQREALVKVIAKKFGVPIEHGRLTLKQVVGEYKKWPQVVRTRRAMDLPVVAHEVFHHLDNVLKLYELVRKDRDTRAELEKLGKPTSKKSYTPSQVQKEGIAEFGRLYWMEGAGTAKMAAPRFYEAFVNRLAGEPEIQEALSTIEQLYADYFSQDIRQHIAANMTSLKDAMAPRSLGARDRFDILVRNWFDRYHLIARAMRKLRKPVRTEDDAYLKAVLALGTPAKAEAYLERGITDPETGELLAPALRDILKPVTGQLDDLAQYMAAQRALELRELHGEDFAIPFDAELLERDIAALGTPAIRKVAGEVRDFLRTLERITIEDAGMLKPGTIDKWKTEEPNYAPMYRAPEKPGSQPAQAQGTGRTFANLGAAVKRAKGSNLPVINPLESIVRDTFRYTGLAQRNRVIVALAKALRETEGSGTVGEIVPVPVEVKRVMLEQLRGVLNNLGVDLEGIDLEGETVKIFNARHFVTPKEAKEQIVAGWENGEPVLISIKDPDLYESLLNLNAESIPAVVKLLTPPARVLHYTATKTAAFLFRNAFRDQPTAAIFSDIERLKIGPFSVGYIPVVDWFMGLADMVRSKDVVRQFYDSGAAQSTMADIYRNYFNRSIAATMGHQVKELRSAPKTLVMSITQLLDFFSNLSEMPTRIGEFRAVLQQEMQKGVPFKEAQARAALAARKVTLDFGVKGEHMVPVNQMTPFSNAAMQDMRTIYRHFRDPKTWKRSLFRALLWITLPTVLLYLVNRNDPNYEELPQYRKDLFWNIPIGDGWFVSVPIPFLLGLMFKTLPERMMQWIDTKDPHAWDDFGKTMVAGALFLPLPLAMTPIIEAWANKRFFDGAPIVPRGEGNLAPEDQYGPGTTLTARLIGRAINTSPRKVEHVVRGYTASWGKTAFETVDIALKAANVDRVQPAAKRGWKDAPVIHSFVSRPATEGAPAILDRFYTDRAQADQLFASLKKRAAATTGVSWADGAQVEIVKKPEKLEPTVTVTSKAMPESQRRTLANAVKAEVMRLPKKDAQLVYHRAAYNKLAQQLSDLRAQRKEAETSQTLTPAAKRKAIEDYNLQMTNLIRKAYRKEPIKPNE